MNRQWPLLVSITILSLSLAASGQFVWIEGEDAVQHTMTPHNWYDSVNRDSLSGRAWLSHFAGGEPPEAQYTLRISHPGDYHFWIRANSVAAPRLSYQLDRGAWTEVTLRNAIENLNIASDAKPDMRFISWINAGQVKLASGSHTIGFRFHSPNNNHGGLDCFVFSAKPFLPRGALKPGAKTGNANPGYFAWEPEVDSFSPDALLDLSTLNEDVAGQNGALTARGSDFTLGSGQKVKFWAVNAGPGIWNLDDASHIYLAKHLAKHGVNMVRLHGGIYGQNDPRVNRERLARLQHMVWALKQEGIYTKISFYFPAWFRLDDWHRQGERWPFMLLFFDEDMHRIYFNWARTLLTTPNPYTGIPLGQDPAVAMLEIQNEDSHFFYTFNKKNAPPARWEILKGLYGQWLTSKYTSIDMALGAWQTKAIEGDDPRAGKMELLNAWHMSAAGLKSAPANRRRIADQTAFLTANMREFYTQAIDYFRDTCRYRGLVSCGNWHTADAQTLDSLERYCYTAGDVIDRHGYFDHNHQGESASYSVRTGHSFTSQSALHLRHNSPLPYVETAGFPNIITEIGWPMPNMYRAESAFLCASYGSLLGMDGIFHFSVGSSSWNQSVGKFILNNPVALGSYFATALIYRSQYLREAPPVVTENLRLEDLLDMKGSAAFVRPALDQFRAAQVTGNTATSLSQSIDPMAFYVGRVVRHFEGQPDQSRIENLAPYIDRDAKTIASITGELYWDYGQGVVTMNAPKAQGAAGFLGRHGQIDLNDLSIDMKNDYGTVTVVPLDNKPLAQSETILIQCMTVDQLYGWQTSRADGLGGTITHVGTAPWGMESYEVSVTFKGSNTASPTVIPCDENGYATDTSTRVTHSSGQWTLHINPSSAYTIVKR
jgi:hypothetical protein